jgi:hypothetical protein
MNLLGLTRSPNFYQGGTLIIDGLYSNGCTGTASVIIDAGVNRALVQGLVVEPSSSSAVFQVNINCPSLLAQGWFTDASSGTAPIVYIGGSGGSNGGTYKFMNSILKGGIRFALSGIELDLANVDISGGLGNIGAGIRDSNTAAASSSVNWAGGSYDGTAGFTYPWLKSDNGTNWAGVFRDVTLTHIPAPAFTGITFTGTSVFRGNSGYNPVGTVSPGVPASGSAVAAVAYDRTFYITTAAGTSTFAIQNGPTITIPATGFGTVRVPAGKTLTPTYTNAPTWVVEGE